MDLNPKFTPVLVELDNAKQSVTDSEPSISSKHKQGLRKMSSGMIPDPFSMETLTFNVGGKRFETYASTLDRDCNCLLSKKAFLQAHYRKDTGEYFFDRDPDIFKSILNYMRTRKLHLPAYVCGPAVKHEFEFWGLSPKKIEQCCWMNYNEWNVTHRALQRLERDRKVSLQSRDTCTEDNVQWNDKSWWSKKWQCKVWRFLNRPKSSHGAKVYGIISLFFVLMSIFTFHAETTSMFDNYKSIVGNSTNSVNISTGSNETGNDTNNATILKPNALSVQSAKQECPKSKHPIVLYIDIICLTFFISEYLVRFVFAPRKFHFVFSLLSIIDLLAIFPDLVEITLLISDSNLRENLEAVNFLNVLRVMRMLRIFRLFRHVPGLWILIYTLRASFSELMVLVWFLLVGMLVFSSLVYFAEGGDSFSSIPGGFWWAIVTMTTVGYGDVYPRTTAGKVIGCFCAISGLLMIGFTVPSLVNNFTLYYRHIHFAVERNVKDEKVKDKRKQNASSEHQSILLKNELVNGLKPTYIDVGQGHNEHLEEEEQELEAKLLDILNHPTYNQTESEKIQMNSFSICDRSNGRNKNVIQ